MRIVPAIAAVAIAVSTALPVSAACKAPAFTGLTITSPATNGAPYGLATLDLNRDGYPDLAFTDYATSTIYIAYGSASGPGTPTALSSSQLQNPIGIVTADVNGDGVPDIISANRAAVVTTSSVGGFISTTSYPIAAGANATNLNAIAGGDFNGDGKIDVAVADYANARILVLLGKAAGTWTAGPTITTDAGPFDVVAADMNHDGKLDLVVATLDGKSLSVYTGDGTGSFAVLPAGGFQTGAHRIAVGDYRKDGALDAILAMGDGSVYTALGSGLDASYQLSATNFYTNGTSAWGATLADINGDGNLDAVVTNRVDSTVSVALGDGTGHFGSPTKFQVGSGPVSVIALDFNGDGKMDLVTADKTGNDLTLLTNSCRGTGGDVNGDGMVTSADIFYLVNYLFAGGTPPIQ